VFFAWHVWWPLATHDAPFSGQFDSFSLLLTIAAALALMRYNLNVIAVIFASAGLGVVKTFLIA